LGTLFCANSGGPPCTLLDEKTARVINILVELPHTEWAISVQKDPCRAGT
jgi:hypothetical protein